MFKHYFELIEGVAIYPIISLTLFFLVFTSMLVWASRISKKYVENMSQMPLESDEDSPIYPIEKAKS